MPTQCPTNTRQGKFHNDDLKGYTISRFFTYSKSKGKPMGG